MIYMKNLVTIFSFLTLVFACNSVKKSITSTESEIEVVGIEEGFAESNPCAINYKGGNNFSISFYSEGAGINYSSKMKLDSIITRFNSDNSDPISNTIEPWGREGELDYKFLSDSSGYNTFLSFKKKICFEMGNDSLVRFKEL